jgi:hypothetical protein
VSDVKERAPEPEIRRIVIERRDAEGNLLGVLVWPPEDEKKDGDD